MALLGTDSDRAIAKRLRRSVRSVEGARRARGILGHSGKGFGGIKWTPEAEALLGTAPDHVVAAALGTTRCAVLRRRKRLGVPRYRRPGVGRAPQAPPMAFPAAPGDAAPPGRTRIPPNRATGL